MEQTLKTSRQHFYSTLIKLAIPVTIQNMITSSLQLVDTVMIGQLGEIEVAAVGLANRFFFILVLLQFAISSGTAIFTAQYWGKQDVQHIGKVMAIALIFGLIVGTLFMSGALLLPGTIMGVFTTDTAVIADGITYLRFVGLSYVLMPFILLYAFVLRSIEQPRVPMYGSILAIGLNTALNYCLIFGHFGFPQWGVKGAAIATLIARVIEVGIIVGVSIRRKYPLLAWGDFFAVPRTLVKQFWITTFPVVANEFSWVMGMTVYSIVYGRMGTAEIAAINIVNPVEHVSSSIFFGLASAASVMIGNQIGAGREHTARDYAIRYLLLGPLGAVAMGGLLALSAPFIISVFRVSVTVQEFAANVLYILSLVLWIRIFNLICVVGILRGGGDTKFSMYLEMGSIWLVGVPLALLGGFVLKIPVYWVFALVSVEEVVKMLAGIYRIRSGKWIHNLVDFTSH